MQQSFGRHSNKMRTGAILFVFLIVVTVIAVQFAVRPSVDDVVPRAIERERVPLEMRAELHWRSMILGERDAFLASLEDDVLFVVQLPLGDSYSDAVDEPIVLKSLSAVADEYTDGALLGLRASTATVTIIEKTEDRVIGVVVAESIVEDVVVRDLEFKATVRINSDGRVFEERLDIVYIAE